MKTGIVRRIDDLGRVAIPKEIRRSASIREGDALEISVDDKGNIYLHKYVVNLDDEIDCLKEEIKTSANLSYETQERVMVLLNQARKLVKGEG